MLSFFKSSSTYRIHNVIKCKFYTISYSRKMRFPHQKRAIFYRFLHKKRIQSDVKIACFLSKLGMGIHQWCGSMQFSTSKKRHFLDFLDFGKNFLVLDHLPVLSFPLIFFFFGRGLYFYFLVFLHFLYFSYFHLNPLTLILSSDIGCILFSGCNHLIA